MTDVQRPQSAPGAPGAATTDEQSQQGGIKEEAAQLASTAGEKGKETASAAVGAGSEVAGTAAEGAREVASEAAQQATEVTRQVTTQARDVAQAVQTQLREQANSQAQRAAGGLRDLSEQVRALSEGQPDRAGVAADGARQVADKIGEWAGRLDERGLDGAVEDLRLFARRRPGLFLLSAAASGFVVARLGRGLQAAQQSSPQGQSTAQPSPPTDGRSDRQTVTVPAAPIGGGTVRVGTGGA